MNNERWTFSLKYVIDVEYMKVQKMNFSTIFSFFVMP